MIHTMGYAKAFGLRVAASARVLRYPFPPPGRFFTLREGLVVGLPDAEQQFE